MERRTNLTGRDTSGLLNPKQGSNSHGRGGLHGRLKERSALGKWLLPREEIRPLRDTLMTIELPLQLSALARMMLQLGSDIQEKVCRSLLSRVFQPVPENSRRISETQTHRRTLTHEGTEALPKAERAAAELRTNLASLPSPSRTCARVEFSLPTHSTRLPAMEPGRNTHVFETNTTGTPVGTRRSYLHLADGCHSQRPVYVRIQGARHFLENDGVPRHTLLRVAVHSFVLCL